MINYLIKGVNLLTLVSLGLHIRTQDSRCSGVKESMLGPEQKPFL